MFALIDDETLPDACDSASVAAIGHDTLAEVRLSWCSASHCVLLSVATLDSLCNGVKRLALEIGVVRELEAENAQVPPPSTPIPTPNKTATLGRAAAVRVGALW